MLCHIKCHLGYRPLALCLTLYRIIDMKHHLTLSQSSFRLESTFVVCELLENDQNQVNRVISKKNKERLLFILDSVDVGLMTLKCLTAFSRPNIPELCSGVTSSRNKTALLIRSNGYTVSSQAQYSCQNKQKKKGLGCYLIYILHYVR